MSLSFASVNSATLSHLGLETYELKEPVERWTEFVLSSLAKLRLTYPCAFEAIHANTRRLVWLKPAAPKSVPSFACASFHGQTGDTFITDLAFRHVPADVLFEDPSTYAIQENLYHEALHQSLCRMIDRGSIFSPDVQPDTLSRPVIDIPWRGTSWSIEKALHAYYVYSHVREMRISCFPPENIVRKSAALEQAHRAVTVLGNAISRYQNNLLGPAGRELTQSLKERQLTQ